MNLKLLFAVVIASLLIAPSIAVFVPCSGGGTCAPTDESWNLTYVLLSGERAMTGNLSHDMYYITNVSSGSSGSSLVNKSYVDSAAGAVSDQYVLKPLGSAQQTNNTLVVSNASGSQLTVAYDTADRLVTSVSSTGITALQAYGSAPQFQVAVQVPTAVDAIPTMTSNTAPSGEAYASSINSATYAAWKAFDDTWGGDTGWASLGGVTAAYISYQFSSSTAIGSYSLRAESHPERMPKDWTFEGWDGANWVVLDTKTGVTFSTAFEKKTYSIANTNSYIKYRLNVTAVGGSTLIHVAEIEMFGTTSTATALSVDNTLKTTLYGNLGMPSGGKIIPASDSTTAIQIANAAGTGFFTADTTNKRLTLTDGNTPASSLLSNDYFIVAKQGGATGLNVISAGGTGDEVYFRPVFKGTRSRGTLATPTAVVPGDELLSFLSNGHDGTTVQAGALIDFIVDGAVSSGHVPTRISFTTGTTSADRLERMTVTSAGNVNVSNALITSKIQPIADSTTAIQIANAAGTPVLTVDTTNGRLGIGGTPGNTFEVNLGTVSSINKGINLTAGNGFFQLINGASGANTFVPTFNGKGTVYGYGLLFNAYSGNDAAGEPVTLFRSRKNADGALAASTIAFQWENYTDPLMRILGSGFIQLKPPGKIGPMWASTTAVQITNEAGTPFVNFDSTNGRMDVGISPGNTAALLDLTSTTKGFLPPRMTGAQKEAIASAPAGLIVWDSTNNTLSGRNSTGWMLFGQGGGSMINNSYDTVANVSAYVIAVNTSMKNYVDAEHANFTGKLTMRPSLNAGKIAGTGKPTAVTVGAHSGYSMPIYAANDEELFFREYVAGRWDGASDINVSVIYALADAEDAGDKFKFQLSWENTPINSGAISASTTDVPVETTVAAGRTAQYSVYTQYFPIDWDLPATDIAAGDHIGFRIRRIAAAAPEVSNEIIVLDTVITYNVNKVYKAV